jgi:hypothetical protein
MSKDQKKSKKYEREDTIFLPTGKRFDFKGNNNKCV